MKAKPSKTEIAIAGAGPVGLYLAGLLLQEGFCVTVLEKKKAIEQHSKSLGIHPVSLDLFDKSGICKPFLASGLKIDTGTVYVNRTFAGELSFQNCPPPHNYILALPQFKTEEILQGWVESLNRETLRRGAELVSFRQLDKSVRLNVVEEGNEVEMEFDFLIGCDGKFGVVRKLSRIPYTGGAYPDTYLMGDFSDNTPFGRKAVVYLHQQGLIESFPLPNGQRRWVIQTEKHIDQPERRHIEHVLEKRIGHSLQQEQCAMVSSFGVQHFIADRFVDGRVILVGDAAHVVSPIGGQGMNLGWLDAAELAERLTEIRRGEPPEESLCRYQRSRRQAALKGIQRAEMNMKLGRKSRLPVVKALAAFLLTQTPLQRPAAKRFTMRGLENWWI